MSKFFSVRGKYFAHPFFEADDGGTGGAGGSEGGDNGGKEDKGGNDGGGDKSIDYDKLAELVAGKQKATEESVIKGYCKNLGLTKEEAEKALKEFKDKKEANKPDIDKLNADLANANSSATAAKIETEAYKLAETIGISAKSMEYVFKLADLSDVVAEDGKIDSDKLKNALEKVLNDIPEFKAKKDDNANRVKVGADGDGQTEEEAKDSALRAAMGLPPRSDKK